MFGRMKKGCMVALVAGGTARSARYMQAWFRSSASRSRDMRFRRALEMDSPEV